MQCAACDRAYWLEVIEDEGVLVVHEAEPPSDADTGALPRVIGRPTKDAGTYRLGVSPSGLAPHNQASWRIIAAILDAYGQADFYDLAVAVRGHQHGDKKASGPQSFVSYCISCGWLVRV